MRKKTIPKQINTPLYRYWQALYMSFYSKRLYIDVAKRWKGFCFAYLLLMIAVVSIPISIRLAIEFNQYFNEQLMLPLKKLPPLYIHQGEVIFDKPVPYFIKDKQGSVVAMIDTRPWVVGMDSAYPDLMLLITKNKLYYRSPKIPSFVKANIPMVNNPVSVDTLDTHYSDIFVASEWIKSSRVMKLKWLGTLLVYPMIVPLFFGMCFSFLFMFAMIAQVFSWLIFKFKMSFKKTYRVLIVATTPQTAIFMLLLSVNSLFKGIGIFCAALGAVYFSYAVISIKRESKMIAHS